MAEAGDILNAIEAGLVSPDIAPTELGELTQNSDALNQVDDHTTIFKSVGNAAQDLVAANVVYEKAISGRIGQQLST
jgi:ornithine cyclodeaminase/alanine dehydrogenase-like protein (mu-crystallin family)